MTDTFSAKHAIAIRNAFTQAFEGMRVLGEAQLTQPFLVVLYSTMDTAAWLAAEHDGDVTRADFVAWVDRFVLPESGLACSALDLYAARCGILHTASAYSSLQRRGEARLICYAGSVAAAVELQAILKETSPEGAISVYLGDLANALIRGWNRFILSLETNPEAVRRMAHRAGDLFGHASPPSGERPL